MYFVNKLSNFSTIDLAIICVYQRCSFITLSNKTVSPLFTVVIGRFSNTRASYVGRFKIYGWRARLTFRRVYGAQVRRLSQRRLVVLLRSLLGAAAAAAAAAAADVYVQQRAGDAGRPPARRLPAAVRPPAHLPGRDPPFGRPLDAEARLRRLAAEVDVDRRGRGAAARHLRRRRRLVVDARTAVGRVGRLEARGARRHTAAAEPLQHLPHLPRAPPLSPPGPAASRAAVALHAVHALELAQPVGDDVAARDAARRPHRHHLAAAAAEVRRERLGQVAQRPRRVGEGSQPRVDLRPPGAADGEAVRACRSDVGRFTVRRRRRRWRRRRQRRRIHAETRVVLLRGGRVDGRRRVARRRADGGWVQGGRRVRTRVRHRERPRAPGRPPADPAQRTRPLRHRAQQGALLRLRLLLVGERPQQALAWRRLLAVLRLAAAAAAPLRALPLGRHLQLGGVAGGQGGRLAPPAPLLAQVVEGWGRRHLGDLSRRSRLVDSRLVRLTQTQNTNWESLSSQTQSCSMTRIELFFNFSAQMLLSSWLYSIYAPPDLIYNPCQIELAGILMLENANQHQYFEWLSVPVRRIRNASLYILITFFASSHFLKMTWFGYRGKFQWKLARSRNFRTIFPLIARFPQLATGCKIYIT